jgi:hypothetical protein
VKHIYAITGDSLDLVNEAVRRDGGSRHLWYEETNHKWNINQ